ncbi:Reverse transcriptase domain and Peptidase A2A, retrovirus RVP subgroup domain and Aspartic peptidase domain-containing protein [Strongyloides ratti]|uniref:Reverse transcriptase domain and Peptidase A2A, retrovirus RVP subgroup domain and Aspartic peptidase domain-containing protein n=1 Tax=Strongyloides ratti TaxID=34506 RepID=A0A090KVS2_STRRB|nr:Reverse transcriptase domain and Peptidase A2A, retrovirus RVP subgroup domain and Aspartic peptidase domain-containing protein [Strongyloides ratti]CEF61600.1 Reverse transcriptase domain and Peptidase A2A, retrovirus RVP subgroup domain and Aspartic peptidase domain-containing protein [Strongyloides ratti]
MKNYFTRSSNKLNFQGLSLSEQFKILSQGIMDENNDNHSLSSNLKVDTSQVGDEKENLDRDPIYDVNRLSQKRTSSRESPVIARRREELTEKIYQLDKKISLLEENMYQIKEELKDSIKESIIKLQNQFMQIMKNMFESHKIKENQDENDDIENQSRLSSNSSYIKSNKNIPNNIRLQNFEGDNKISFNTWIEKFEIFVEENEIPPNKYLKILKYYLGEDPATTIRNCKDFKEAVKMLHENYNDNVSNAAATSMLNSIKTKRIRTLEDLNKYIPIIEEAHKALYRIKSTRMENQVIFLKDMLSSELKLYFNDVSNKDWALFICQIKDKMVLLKRAKEEQEIFNRLKRKKNEKKCKYEKCKFPNSHETKDCRYKIRDEKNTLFCNQNIYNGLAVINGKINQIDAKFVIDTGSNISILNDIWVNKLNLQVSEDNITTVQNINTICTLKRCKGEIEITLNEANFKLKDPYLFVSKEHKFDLLVGSDILMKTKGFYISYNDNKSIKFKIIDENEIQKEENKECLEYFQKEYPMCFAKTDKDLTPFLEAEKQLIYENMPINPKYPSYPLGIHEQKIALEIIKDWQHAQIVEEGVARINHPVIIVKKANAPPDGTVHEKYRFVTDLRRINSITEKIYYNSPSIFNLLQNTTKIKIKWLSKIDLKSAFSQIKLNKNDIGKFGFSIGNKSFIYKCLPMGARNSSILFMIAIKRIFQELIDNEQMWIYQDDVILKTTEIKGESEKESLERHINLIHETLKIMKNYGIKASYGKCLFCKKQLDFLGFSITTNGYQASKTSIKRIIQSLPKNREQLRRFLYALNYYRLTIKDFARKTSKLYDLINQSKNTKFQWTDATLEDYHNLIKDIINQKTLKYGNINEKYYLNTDASDEGLGSVLYQKEKIKVLKEQDKVIGFYSSKLDKVNKKRHSTYLELKCIADSLDYFSFLLREAKAGIVVVTDHLPLKKLILTSDQRKYIKLIHRIDSFNIQIQFIKGKENVIPDWFSRIKENPEEKKTIKCYMANRGRKKKIITNQISEEMKPLQNEKQKENQNPVNDNLAENKEKPKRERPPKIKNKNNQTSEVKDTSKKGNTKYQNEVSRETNQPNEEETAKTETSNQYNIPKGI